MNKHYEGIYEAILAAIKDSSIHKMDLLFLFVLLRSACDNSIQVLLKWTTNNNDDLATNNLQDNFSKN